MEINKIKKLDTGITGTGADILYANNKYFLLSSNPTKLCVSDDLKNWEEIDLSSYGIKPSKILYGNNTYVILDKTNGIVLYSSDYYNWKTITINSNGLNFGKFCNGYFYFGSNNSSTSQSSGKYYYTYTIYYTQKCTSLISRTIQHQVSSTDISFIPQTFSNNGTYGVLLGGSDGNFLYNILYPSTSSVKMANIGTKGTFYDVNYCNDKFITVGSKGRIYTSINSSSWNSQTSGVTSTLTNVIYSDGKYVVVGYNGTILVSDDGYTWNDKSLSDSMTLNGITSDSEKIIISTSTKSSNNTMIIYYTIDIEYTSTPKYLLEGDKDSSLWFFDRDLNLLGIIDSFISLRWRPKYNEPGEFEIVLPDTEYLENFLNYNIFIMRNNYDEAGLVQTIQKTKDNNSKEITLSGKFLNNLFNQRIVKSTINFNGSVTDGISTIINNVTEISDKLTIEEPDVVTNDVVFQCTYKNAMEYMYKLTQYAGISFKLLPNVKDKIYQIVYYEGTDRSYLQNTNSWYTFSEENCNLPTAELIGSVQDKINYVLVGGEGEGSDRTLVEVDDGSNSSGWDLYEKFLDEKSMSSDDLTTSEYEETLKTEGLNNLSSGTFSLEITTSSIGDYKVKWDLGDIVNVEIDDWNIKDCYRIIEVEEVIEDGTKTVYPTFGSASTTSWTDDDN